jgi:hypothetical protein
MAVTVGVGLARIGRRQTIIDTVRYAIAFEIEAWEERAQVVVQDPPIIIEIE